MVKKCAVLSCLLLLISVFARAEYEVTTLEGEEFYPEKENWTYQYHYKVPQLQCEETDGAALMINETLVTALDEMKNLVLPMLSNAPEMLEEGNRTVEQDYMVTCSNDHFFSFLTLKKESTEKEDYYSVESQTFDVGGDYPGEMLTLRGVVMVGESSDQIGAAVLPELYRKFVLLQQAGFCRKDVTQEEFEKICSPTLDFYTDQDGNAVFFFQPYLMENPSFSVPSFSYTPEMLEKLCENMPRTADE